MNTKNKAVAQADQLPKEIALKSIELNDRQDIEHPLVFADQLSALAVGPFVSKFSLAIENHGQKQRVPVITVTMPTNALHQLAFTILTAMSQESTQIQLKELQAAFVAQLEGVKISESK